MSRDILSALSALVLASVHLFAGRLHQGVRIRPAWLTAAAGMSVAYVFVDMMPELGKTEAGWIESSFRVLPWLETGVYVAVLAGLILYLAVDRVARQRREQRFWIQIGGFSAYNALIGGFGVDASSATEVALGVIAFGAHFLINDHRLHTQYGELYERSGRCVLAGAIVVGWAVALVWHIPTLVAALIVALVAGGMMLNVIKEEMPERDEGRLSPWIAGAVSYTVLILALTYSQHQ